MAPKNIPEAEMHLKQKLFEFSTDLGNVGKFLEANLWAKLGEEKEIQVLHATGNLLNLIFLASKYDVDLSDLRQQLFPRLFLALRPIYFYVIHISCKFRNTRGVLPLQVRSALKFIFHDTTRFFSKTDLRQTFEELGTNEACRYLDDTINLWSEETKNFDTEEERVDKSDLVGIPRSHEWWVHCGCWN